MAKTGITLALSNAIYTTVISIAYFCSGDPRRGIYWGAATVITLAVTL